MAEPIRVRLLSADDQRIEVGVRDPGASERTMWFASAEPVWEAPPPTLDFAAVALAHCAAFRGHDLHLEGAVTSAQLDHLDEFLGIWSIGRPEAYRRVAVSAEDERPVRSPDHIPARSAMAYSSGVDAGFALALHHDGGMSRLNRKIDLGVLVVGSDLKHGDDHALAVARESAERVLGEYDARLAVVASNWRQKFCDKWFMSFNTGFMAVLHTFSATHSPGIHATDHNYGWRCDFRPTAATPRSTTCWGAPRSRSSAPGGRTSGSSGSSTSPVTRSSRMRCGSVTKPTQRDQLRALREVRPHAAGDARSA